MQNAKKSPTHKTESDYILLETKPQLLLYADNFITKIIVLLLLFFFISPAQAIVSQIQTSLMISFNLNLINMVGITLILFLLAIIIVIVKLLLDIMDWNYTIYTFTQSRLIIKRGFLRKEEIFMPYYKIQDMQVSQSILERLFSVGQIIIYGGHDNTETILDSIHHPHDIEELISNQMNKKTEYTTHNTQPSKYTNKKYKKSTRHSTKKTYHQLKQDKENIDKEIDTNNTQNNKNKEKRRKYTTNKSIMEKHQSKFNKR